MKLQLDGHHLRLRLDEAELTQLATDGQLAECWPGIDGDEAHCRLRLDAGATEPACAGNFTDLEVVLPRAGFLAFAAERPRRDGFNFQAGTVVVSVEIDVRDSRRAKAHTLGQGDHGRG
ncbi:MAG: hypothetical protein J0M21_00705 [Xanthomonadales bacterium]|uniref:hypothetical protein n=1 Tax=Thermomonas mangrovi TaxID=2993316 RepID=UPI001AC43904|nr:hypothetical protein [Thermomonas mangrovi]MBN8263156.1 hypothetical protein [Xanthomonadales bacterium]